MLLASCSKSVPQDNEVAAEPDAKSAAVSFAGPARDRLCFDPRSRRMSFITYAPDGKNCFLRGSLDQGGNLRPDGDQKCWIPVNIAGEKILLIDRGNDACAYYCAAPATFAGKTFVRMAKPQPVTDIAGDPLC